MIYIKFKNRLTLIFEALSILCFVFGGCCIPMGFLYWLTVALLTVSWGCQLTLEIVEEKEAKRKRQREFLNKKFNAKKDIKKCVDDAIFND